MEIAIPDYTHWVNQLLWPLFRIASFFMAVPMIGSRLLPVQLRLGLAVAVTLVVVPLLPEMPVVDGLSLEAVLITVKQMVIGVALGFMAQLFFHVVVLGGQMISSQMGLGFASVSDPANGVSVVVLSQFYVMLTMLVFLSMNGHLVFIQIIVDSFHIIPVANRGVSTGVYWEIATGASWVFSAALLMALPAVIALLIVNLAFGIMTKAAPQLNIFAIGFPFTMIFGLFITWVSMADYLGQYQKLASFGLDLMADLLIGGRLRG